MNGIITLTTITAVVWILATIDNNTAVSSAFQVPTSSVRNSNSISNSNIHIYGVSTNFHTRSFQPPPLYMSEVDEAALEEEVERLFQEEKEKTIRMSRFSNEKGMEYAPWMNMSAEDEARIRSLAREKTIARKKRQMQEQNVRGSLLKDSTNQELSGTGLQYKVIDTDSVELEWTTDSEPDTKGYIIKRRASKTPDFVTIASYETYAPLNSKGINGGTYRYLDENVGTGVSYLYRITEKEGNGDENDLSQCLVDIQSENEKRSQLVAIAGFGLVAVAVVAAGLFLDPVQ